MRLPRGRFRSSGAHQTRPSWRGDSQRDRARPNPEGPKTMTFTEAAAEVLRLVGRPLHYKEITDLAIEKNLLSHVGKSPEVTMGARLAALLKKSSKDNPLVRVKPGVFALREWDDATIKGDKTRASAEAPAEATADKVAETASPATAVEGDEASADWDEEEPS